MDNTAHTSGISVYPAFFMIRLTPGESRKLTVTIYNHFAEPMGVSSRSWEFAQNPDTLLNYLVAENSLENWITSQEFTIAAQKSKTLDFTVTVPAEDTITEGSYYPSLVLTFDTPEESDTSSIELEHAIPIYVEVTENAVAEIDVVRFASNALAIGGTTDITTEIINTGTTYIAPRAFVDLYSISILNNEEKTRIDTLPVNQRRSTLLPGSVLSETASWGENRLGHYEATLYVMSQDEPRPVRQIDFWIVPSEYIFIATGLIAVAVTFTVLRILKSRGNRKSGNKPQWKLPTAITSLFSSLQEKIKQLRPSSKKSKAPR